MSYFVVAHLHQTYIQVTLHQVVKTSSAEENTSAIIVKDEIIPIENVNDTLCKHVWDRSKSMGEGDYCTSHKDEENIFSDVYTLKNYCNFLERLKLHIFKTVST